MIGSTIPLAIELPGKRRIMIAATTVGTQQRYDLDVIPYKGRHDVTVELAAVHYHPVVTLYQRGQGGFLGGVGDKRLGHGFCHGAFVRRYGGSAANEAVARRQIGQVVPTGKALVPHTVNQQIVLATLVGLECLPGLPGAAGHEVKRCHD